MSYYVRVFTVVAALIFVTSLVFYLNKPRGETATEVPTPVTPNSTEIIMEKVPDAKPALENGEAEPNLTEKILINVPFTVQAPLLEWSNPIFQDACEEAATLMAMKWVNNETFGNKADARNEILAISTWETEKYHSYHDTSAADTIARILNGYFNYPGGTLKRNISSKDIISELEKGNLVITPMNGQTLKNPYFTQPGPERHMVLIKGYDPEKQEFVTNDPGVSQGENYHYPVNVFMESIRDYPTGDHVPISSTERNGIIVTNNKL